MAGTVQVVVPDGIDDPLRPSGGNRYDRRVCDGLRALGWRVHEWALPGRWPHPDTAAVRALAGVLDRAADGDLVLLDGLIASAAGDLVVAAAERLRVAVLVHMPLGPVEPARREAERLMLLRVSAVLTTSGWTRHWLLQEYRLPAARVQVAAPGVDPCDATPVARPTTPGPQPPDGGRLLCVAAVTRAKGYDLLLAALSTLGGREWRCRCVGSPEIDPEFSTRLRCTALDRALAGRVQFTGPLTTPALDAEYAAADLLVLPSRAETWGMVVTEALARGIPVLASDVGGIPEALGRTPDGRRPGLLVPAGDPAALADALGRWLDDPALRDRLRSAARARRASLPGWPQTAARVADLLTRLRREPLGRPTNRMHPAALPVPFGRGWRPSTSR